MHFPTGTLAEGAMRMQQQLQERQQREHELNQRNGRIRAALDASRDGFLIADAEHRTVYANPALRAMLQAQLPELDQAHIVGSDLHRFDANPQAARQRLEGTSAPIQDTLSLGHAQFTRTASPVLDEQGRCNGYAVHWHERTQELVLEDNIERIVAAAAAGDLSQRLARTTDTGFIGTLTTGINQLLEAMGGALGEIRHMLTAQAEGNLELRIQGKYQGDFLAMQRDANLTADRLADIVHNIGACSNSIGQATDQIASGNQALAQRSQQQQSDNLQNTATAMEQLTAAVRQNADHAQRANDLSRNAQQVASEVRSLAQRSAEAAKQTKGLIEDSVEKVGTGASLVQQAGATMNDILNSVQQVTAIMAEISAASQEQRIGIEQVSQTVVHMDQATQQNNALVEQASNAIHDLQTQVQQLTQTIAIFHAQN